MVRTQPQPAPTIVLSTPGSNERFLEKAPSVPADMSFLDLEDSVAPLEKEAARGKVVSAIREQSWDDRVFRGVGSTPGTRSGPTETSSRWWEAQASASTR